MPSRRALPALLALCLVLPLPASAGEQINCEDAASTYQINFCADKALSAADAELNAVYEKALAQISASDQEPPYDAKSWEEALRKSQRAWIAFRDADCKDLVPMAWTGGTGTSAEVLGCMTDKTRARTEELKDRFGLDKG